MPSDKDIVEEVRELLARSTPGPWKVYSDSRPDIVTTAEVNSGYMGERHLLSMDKYGTSWGQDFENDDDANLIARAPELLRALADEVERLRPVVNAAVEWRRVGYERKDEFSYRIGPLLDAIDIYDVGQRRPCEEL